MGDYFTGTQSLSGFIINSSFLNHHLGADYLTKLSFIDTILLQASSKPAYLNGQLLYAAFTSDILLQATTLYLPLSSLLHAEYQDPVTTMALLAPDLIPVFTDFILRYVSPDTFNGLPVAVIDSFVDG